MEAFPELLLARFREMLPEREALALSSEDAGALDRFARLSPLYRALLLQHPDLLPWVLAPPSAEAPGVAVLNEWRAFRKEFARGETDPLPALRRFRRWMSLRIAFRNLNARQSEAEAVADLSALAEFSIRECYQLALPAWRARYGDPWDENLQAPARFCVLALGKLGGRELNFSSDIDLIYLYEGEGNCRKDGKSTSFGNAQFFTKVAEALTHLLQEQTEYGFLFRVDLRLRPEGARSPLVRSLQGVENYYAAAGQSWERMAMIKARPVAGDLPLGGELLESLHSFRYPRHPPPSLLSEIAAMKLRTEREVVGSANLHRDVKRGLGGIREIEFIVQTLQLLHAGRYPFLQTNSTDEGLSQLVRYELMSAADARFLREAYWFLRAVEHRLQVREEQQTHTLPSDPAQISALAESFDLPDAAAFEQKLDEVRRGVRSRYDALLQGAPVDEALADWWGYLAEKQVLPSVSRCLVRWFGSEVDPHGPLLDFVRGSRTHSLTRAHVARFTGLSREFDRVMPLLAFPLTALQRIARFADAYGTRNQFLSACSADPRFFEILGLLFDRSEFIHGLLVQHPEILDEVLRPEILRRRKTAADTHRELSQGAPAADFEEWLWLYVKAEQVRIAIGELLGYLTAEETENNLSALADASILFLLDRLDPQQRLSVVALGKYGGGELSFGSDLDLLFLGGGEDAQAETRTVQRLIKVLSQHNAQGPIFPVDLRLRPHGQDGPLVVTLPALRRYHGRQAHAWEKQILTRARVIGGAPGHAEDFAEWLDVLLYTSPPPDEVFQELWDMRMRIERERDRTEPPQLAFKTGAGGLVDLEFMAQFFQLRLGGEHPALRQPNTRRLLQLLGEGGWLDPEMTHLLLENLRFLRSVEVHLRRRLCSGVSVIPAGEEAQLALARWSGYSAWAAFWADYCRTLTTNRRLVGQVVAERFAVEQSPAPVGGS